MRSSIVLVLALAAAQPLVHVLASLRGPLAHCATTSHVDGVVHVRLAIDAAGRAASVDLDVDNADMTVCAGAALSRVTFPASAAGPHPVIAVRATEPAS